MMKSIMFNEHFGLESAVLEGRKTQFRKIVSSKSCLLIKRGYFTPVEFNELGRLDAIDRFGNMFEIKPSYDFDEIVAIKQSCETTANIVGCYDVEIAKTTGWENKMFVKNERMIHSIKITNIRVERLQDISKEDCLKEGVIKAPTGYFVKGLKRKGWRDESQATDEDGRTWTLFPFAHQAFFALSEKVIGRGSWMRNPYVFVYDFELVTNKD